MSHLPSYPSIFQLGHKHLDQLFHDPVLVEEKIDGSQISFGIFDGELIARSKGQQIIIDHPEKMFDKAIEAIKSLADKLVPNWYYRGEYLRTPAHNTLSYERVPVNHIIIFDVDDGEERYLPYSEKKSIADSLGLETVPCLFQGKIDSVDQVKHLMESISILGKAKIEGLVFKNYHRFGLDKHILIGKFVNAEFKEVHEGKWKESNPTQTDIVNLLISTYKTDARKLKAIFHLRDDGKLEFSNKDIGLLIKEIPDDILKEEEDKIKEMLFAHFWPKIRRGIISGIPEFYKDWLLKQQFEDNKQ